MKRPADNGEVIFGPIVFGIVLIALALPGVSNRIAWATRAVEARGADSWSTEEAVVRASSVAEIGGWFVGSSWMPRIEYAYTIDGTEHLGDRFSFNGPKDGLSEAEAAVVAGRFKIGDRIQVHVDPKDAARSTIVPGLNDRSDTGSILDVLLILFGVSSIWRGLRIRRRMGHRHPGPLAS